MSLVSGGFDGSASHAARTWAASSSRWAAPGIHGLGPARRARERDVAAADEHDRAGLRALHHGRRGAVVGTEHREGGRRGQHLHDAGRARGRRSAAVVEHLAGRGVDDLRLQVGESAVGGAVGDRARADAARRGRGGRSRARRVRGRRRGRRRRDRLDVVAARDGGAGEDGARAEQREGEHAAGDREREPVLPCERRDGCPEARCLGRARRGRRRVGVSGVRAGGRRRARAVARGVAGRRGLARGIRLVGHPGNCTRRSGAEPDRRPNAAAATAVGTAGSTPGHSPG